MDEALGHPDADPHGDPIPRDHDPSRSGVVLMSSVAAGTDVQVVRVSDANPDILRFLAERGIAIGTRLRVLSRLSGAGLMTVGLLETEASSARRSPRQSTSNPVKPADPIPARQVTTLGHNR